MLRRQGLGDDDLPPMFVAADASSVRAQTRFIWATRIRLVGLVLAAGFGSFAWFVEDVDIAGAAALCAFLAALGAEVYLLKEQPDRDWYDGRAAAESIKTLAWRYAVRGDPFGIERDVDRLFTDRLGEVLSETRGRVLTPTEAVGPQITDAMREVRSLELDDRRSIYMDGRLRDQSGWYSRKASWNEKRADQWAAGMITVEFAGAMLALLRVTGVVTVDVLGLVGALVAAGAAWVNAKQHRTLARAYSVAAQELGIVATRADEPTNDSAWATFVGDAEEAISREHTLWRASHK